jgi:hypothetical protein
MTCGCDNNQPPKPAEKDKNAAVKIGLIGTWERQSELGPVGYQREFKPDGTLVMREFRKAAPSTSPATQPAGKAGPTMYHRQYKIDLPLFQQSAGTWAVQGDKLIKTIQLSNGDTVRILSRIDPLAATEFVEESDGVDGKVKVKYERKKPA